MVVIKMNKRQEWIDLIRKNDKGYFSPVPGIHTTGESYCCLGILCDMANPQPIIKRNFFQRFVVKIKNIWYNLTHKNTWDDYDD